MEFADVHGADGLSMRKLADSLGSGVMSLYNHIQDKEDLFAQMLDLVVADIELPSADDEWRKAIRTSAASAHAVLLHHPWAAGQWTEQAPGPNRISYMEAILRTLDNAGLSKQSVYHGYHAVTMHIVGFTLQALSYNLGDASLADIADQFSQGFPASEYPHLAAHLEGHVSGAHDDDFQVVLNYILEGLDAAP